MPSPVPKIAADPAALFERLAEAYSVAPLDRIIVLDAIRALEAELAAAERRMTEVRHGNFQLLRATEAADARAEKAEARVAELERRLKFAEDCLYQFDEPETIAAADILREEREAREKEGKA